jgi:hypothetical protein
MNHATQAPGPASSLLLSSLDSRAMPRDRSYKRRHEVDER